MKTLIFLGPTLPLEEAASILDAVYLPPIRQADLTSALEKYQPDIVGIVDGCCDHLQAVWHKEIMYALHKGIKVYGAGGIGALRAVETDLYGTVGVGEVYRMYKTGELTDDDEIALRHENEKFGYRKLSEPMVNIRKTFAHAVAQGVIDETVEKRLVGFAKSLYYPERTFSGIFRKATQENLDPGALANLETFVVENYIDIKRRDAVRLLQAIRDLPAETAEMSKQCDFRKGMLFNMIYNRDRKVHHEGTEVSLHTIATHTALNRPEFSDINFHAMNRALVQFLADLLDVDASKEDIEQEARRFRVKQNLTEEERFSKWLATNDLNEEEFTSLMRELSRCRRLHKWLTMKKLVEGNTKTVLDELRIEGCYEKWAREAARQQRIVAERHPHFEGIDLDMEQADRLVAEHLKATGVRWDTHYSDWAAGSGLSCMSFMLELTSAKYARDHVRHISRRMLEMMMATDGQD